MMMDSLYKPDLYEGNDPFICISYHQNDRIRIQNLLQKLNYRGIRIWLNDGIAPGMDTDEIIAEHIEKCDLFIAFISAQYLGVLDTVDELNYSRDVNKEHLLIFLENTPLPAGLDMRFMRSEGIRAYEMSDEDVWDRLLNIRDL